MTSNCLLWFAYDSFQGLVIKETQSRLVALASLAAQMVSSDVEALELLGDEKLGQARQTLQKSMADTLLTFAQSHQLATVLVLDIDNNVVASTSELDVLGAKPAWAVIYNEQILLAWQGKANAGQPLSEDELIVQCAFAPVVDENGLARGIIWAEADSDFLRREKQYIRRLFWSIALTSFLILVVAGFIFRRLVISYLEASDAIAHTERLSAIGQLAAGVSHEIRNPLSIMTTTCQYLRGELEEKKDVGEGELQLVDDVLGEIDRLNGIVSRFLALARQPSSDEKVESDLSQVVADVVNLVERNFLKRGLELETKVASAMPKVKMAPENVKQVLLNVVLNSADAITEDGVVQISLLPQDDGVLITLRDNGPGFTEEILAQPFEPFLTTKETGTGLGLSLVKNLVDVVSGKVTISNLPDQKGAQVQIWLPGVLENE